jgi:hypothetical protein
MTFYENFTKIQEYVNKELKEEVINILEVIIEEFVLTQRKMVNDELLTSSNSIVHISFEVKNDKIYCLGYKGSSLEGENVKSGLVKTNNEINITFEKSIHYIVQKLYKSICDEVMKKIFSGMYINSHYDESSNSEITIGYLIYLKKQKDYSYGRCRMILDNEKN